MKTIQTVTGTLSLDRVRGILPHEHLLMDMTHEAIEPKTQEEKDLFYGEITMENLGMLRRNPYIVKKNLGLWDEELAVAEVKPLMDAGCNLFVDLTTMELGRDVHKLRSIAQKTGLNIVCGCGMFVNDIPPDAYRKMTAEALAELMVKEITEGIDGTDIRAGVIGEIGTSDIIYPAEERGLRAAGLASLRTGRPIYIHTYPWSRAGLDALHLLMDMGVSPEKICICHLDVQFDEEYILSVLRTGAYVEFDNLGKEFVFEPVDAAFAGGPFETDWERVRMLKKLTDAGFAERLLISNDICLQISLHAFGGWGYDHMFKNFVPMMKMGGIDPELIDTIVDKNPRRFLFD